MAPPWTNQLYFGDNLAILREYIPDESVDLVYLDPPFNSQATYNVLFAEKSGEKSAAQIAVFEDTWQWGEESEHAFWDVVSQGPPKMGKLLSTLREFLGNNDLMAYLTMMAVRLLELHRVLKPTGSIYLHCDPTASHYLKIVMDAVFGAKNFLNEICWKRSSAHSDTKQGMKRCGKVRDLLLLYTKSENYTWNPLYTPYTQEYLDSEYRHVTRTGRPYKETDLTAAKPGGDTEYAWHVKRSLIEGSRWEDDIEEECRTPKPNYQYKTVYPYSGRFWAYSKENIMQFAKSGQLIHRKTGMPRLMQFADEMLGVPLQDLWIDIPPETGSKDLGYPTQKPEALLERIIQASSNVGDIVLDPFCGCGTAIAAAERLHRRWIGLDITHLAITLIKHRLHDAYGSDLAPYEVIGDPKDLASAKALAEQDRYQFEWWAVGLVHARPAHDKRKGADQGVDGYLFFLDDNSGKPKSLIVQVKSGGVSVRDIRELDTVRRREKAEIGVLVTLQASTRPMEQEAAAMGFYEPVFFPGIRFPKLQILTIAELLQGKDAQYPRVAPTVTFKRAQRQEKNREPQTKLF